MRRSLRMLGVWVVMTGLLWGASGALAQTNQGSGKGQGRHGPPPQAIEACNGKTAGDQCEFKGRKGDILKGTCFTPDKDKPLACRPNDRPPPQR